MRSIEACLVYPGMEKIFYSNFCKIRDFLVVFNLLLFRHSCTLESW
ncbi:MAG: hypothetical protein ACTSVI_00640 [Promethearchaeota archaeon]